MAEGGVPLELRALRGDGLLGKLGSLLPEFNGRESFALFVLHALQHLELDRKAMAIPAGYIPNLAALEHVIPVDEILQGDTFNH